MIITEVGQKAPDVLLYDIDKKPVKISDFKGKTTVLLFFPGAFTGTCTKEMCMFRDEMSRYNNLNAKVVGISVDSPFALKGFKNANSLDFPLLSDFARNAVNLYGVLMQDFGGLPGYTAAKRSVFVLDRDQKIRFKWVSDNPGVEPDYATVAREAEAVK